MSAIPTQAEVKAWITERGMSYPQFAKEMRCATQTVRGWMAPNKPKPMREQHLVAAGRLMHERSRVDRVLSGSFADLTPEDWRECAFMARDLGVPGGLHGLQARLLQDALARWRAGEPVLAENDASD